MQMQNAPAEMIAPDNARRNKRKNKQREYRAAEPDTRDPRPSLKQRDEINERSKLRRKRKVEKRSQVGKEMEMEGQCVVDVERIAKEKREATKASMAGQEILDLD